MEQIIIHKKDGTSFPLMSKDPLRIIESASQQMVLMGEDTINIKLKVVGNLNLSYGDKIIIYGREYFLRSEPSVQRLGDNLFAYQLQFMGVIYELIKSQYRSISKDGSATSSSFDLTGKLVDFIKLIPMNVSRSFANLWSFDEKSCPNSYTKTLSFSKDNCLSALQRVIKEYDQEFYIDQIRGKRIIKIGKGNLTIDPPNGDPYFQYGKGKGLYDLELQRTDDRTVITRLWAEGGHKNIKSDYRNYSQRLQLPLSKIGDESKRYVEDKELNNKLGDIIEDTEFFDNIYPTREGTVSYIDTQDILSFYDDDMNFDLNEKDSEGNTKWLVNGIAAKIVFTTGSLAGQEFNLSHYNHDKKKFKIVEFTDSRGLMFPDPKSDAFRINQGDKYKITDINLPDSYISEAENKLWEAASKKLEERKQPRAAYKQTFDKMYFKQYIPEGKADNIFLPGDYVPVKDERLGIEKGIQVQKVTRNLLDNYDYTLELSDITTVSIIANTISTVTDHKRIIEKNNLNDPNTAKRGWRTTEDLRNMIYDPDGYFGVENIKPNSIDTGMLAVDVKAQRFILEGVIMQANYLGHATLFNATGGKLIHMSIASKPKTWNLIAITIEIPHEAGYYVFAKCSKTSDLAQFIVLQHRSEAEPKEDPDNYYFQIGTLGPIQNGFRDFNTSYGFTRLNGNFIKTGKIATYTGNSFLDLDNDKLRIGDSKNFVDWNVSKDKQLTLSNVKLLSGSGDTAGIGVFRGVYKQELTYHTDDEVTYNGSTYRYISPTPTQGVFPPDATHWTMLAAGGKGDYGPTLVYRGDYDATKTYYGTPTRVDAVKYENLYYLARVYVGEGFSGRLPTNNQYWMEFGNQLDAVATDLKLAQNAKIGDWYNSNGKIVSTLDGKNKVSLDSKGSEIKLESSVKSGYISMNAAKNNIILNNDTGHCNIKPGSIYSMPEGISFGGDIYNFCASGFTGSIKSIEDDTIEDIRRLNVYDTFVIGHIGEGVKKTVWLPKVAVDGRIIIIKQMGIGVLVVMPPEGFYMADDSSFNSSCYLNNGNMMIAILSSWWVDFAIRYVWTVSIIRGNI